jgi:hypothetical protein
MLISDFGCLTTCLASAFGVTEPGSDDVPHSYDTGIFCEEPDAPQRHELEPGLDGSGTTINTLTLMHQDAAPEKEFLARDILGPDESQVQLASTVKSPSNQNLWWKTRNRITLWK